jgi:hypothetical protein
MAILYTVKPQLINMADKLTKSQEQLILDRKEWQKQYSHFLTRKNKFAVKLQEAGRTTEGSAKYQQLDAEVKKYFGLLRGSLPEYKAMFNSPNR